jgi:hypothetical protein
MNKILDNILAISELSKEEKESFKSAFYKLVIVKTLDEIASIDSVAFVKLNDALHQADTHPEVIHHTIDEISQNPEVKEKINHIIVEVLVELADIISSSASKQQRKEILTSLT